MNIASLLVLALAANAAPPPYSLTVSDEKAEAALRPSWSFFGGRLDVQPVVKAGVLALTETFPYPYPILKRSPYALGGVALAYAGAVDAAAVVTLGAVNLRSHSLLGDDKSAFATPADHFKGKDLSQNQLVSSVYLDAGKRFEAGGWKGAVYAAADALGWTAPGAKYGSDGLLEGSVGSAWLKKSGDREISFFGAVGAEAAPGSAYRNDGTLTAAPFGRAGAEVAMQSGGRRWGTGVEVQTRRADDSVRPYVDLKAAGAQAVLALELKRSKNAFYPDSQAVAAGVKTKVG